MEPNITNLMIIGLLMGLTKFSTKAAFGCSFAALRKREILAVSSVYFLIAFMISTLLGGVRALDKVWNILLNFAPLLGLFQGIIALLLIVIGLHTIRKWINSKEDLTRKSFLVLSIPCPGTVATITLSCLFLLMNGMKSVNVGILIGSFFFISILGISFTIRKSKLKKSPVVLGGIMIFFGLFYLLSILIIPAYIPVSKMDITITELPLIGVMQGFILIATMISIGFILERRNSKNKAKCSC